MLSINFIGCGNLGKTLGRLITRSELGIVKGIVTTSLQSANAAAEFIGSGTGYINLKELSPADIYFITTRDDLIEKACNQLISEARIRKGAIFIHCSGSLSSDVLEKAREVGGYAMSVHPIKSFANALLNVDDFSGTYCGYEGDESILPVINTLFTGIGAILFPLKKEQKIAYHAAGVLANNYLVGLHYVASACYQLAGLDEDLAYKITSMLMKDALQNIEKTNHRKALTGPLQRGDIATIEKHLSHLSCVPQIKAVYSALGEATISITEHKKELKNSLISLFSRNG